MTIIILAALALTILIVYGALTVSSQWDDWEDWHDDN